MFGFLKIKPRNRRCGDRSYLLDVKLRAGQRRAARMRGLGLGLAVLLGVGAALVLGWRGGQWLLDRLVYHNEAFAIELIQVQTDGVIAPETLRSWAMVKKGQNLLALDLMKVKRDLEMQPAIEYAAVERVLPRTLRISVNEREPMARTQVMERRGGGAWQTVDYDFDREGFVMRPLEGRWRAWPAPPPEALPELVGISAAQVQPGRQVESAQIRAALGLLSELERSPMAAMVQLRRISVAAPEILETVTTQGARITFSVDHLDVQLRRWRQIHDYYQRQGKAIVGLDLSVSNNLPVQWAALAPRPPAPAVKTDAPGHPRKKNV